MKQVRYTLSVLLFTIGACTLNAQQLVNGDTFTYTDVNGVDRLYKVVGENLVENPEFDNNIEGWVSGSGGVLDNTEVYLSGGADGGAYIVPKSSSGKGSNGSIGTTWTIEKGKTYVFSFYLRNSSNVNAENPASDGYIKVSTSDIPCEETNVLQPLAYVNADLAWTQNTWVFKAEHTTISLCARWLGGRYCFDSFLLAEVEELPNSQSLSELLARCNDYLTSYEDPIGVETFQYSIIKGTKMLDSFEDYAIESVNAMIEELEEALFDFCIANASDEYPMDITERFIKNSKFDNGFVDWNVVNKSIYQGFNFRNFAYFDDNMNPVCEIVGKPIVESSICQMVYNLPKGYYRLSVQCVMDYALDSQGLNAKSGAVLFLGNKELDMFTQQITKENASYEDSYPETFIIESYIVSDSVAIGFKALPDVKFDYIAIDNITLECLGIDNSSEDNEGYEGRVDMTDKLINPDFEDDANGWTIVGGNKIAATSANYGYHGTNFIEEWVAAPSTLGDREWSQTIQVPNGFYVIKSLAHAILQSDAGVSPEGVYIYANKDEVQVTTNHLNPPAEYSVLTNVTDGRLKVGYRITSSNVNWAAWDYVRIYQYVATTEEEALGMYAKDEMNLLIPIVEELLVSKFQTSLKNDLAESISSIEDIPLVEAKDFWEALKRQIESAKQSVSAYAEFYKRLNEAHELQKRGYHVEVENFNNVVADADWEYQIAQLDVKEIKNITSSLEESMINFFILNANGDDLLDVTDMYIINPTLRKGNHGWSGSTPDLEHEVMELYNCDFDMYQTLTGIPNGIYKVNVQGLYRTTWNDAGAAYNAGTETITAEFYANDASTPLTSIYKYKASTMGVTNSQVLNDYVNMRVSINEAFNLTNLYTGKLYYDENELIVNVQDNTLKIGLRNSDHLGGSWCAFRDFRLFYCGEEEKHKKYEVVYLFEGNVISRDSIRYGTKIPCPDYPAKEGYTIRWECPDYMPVGDVVVTGRYEINKYNLRYIVDGKVFKEDSVTYQAAITPEATIPVKEGHTFIGWNNLPAIMPASDVEVEALFKVNKYCITYVIDNVVIATEFVEYGDNIVLMDPPVKDGYTFAGWSYVPEKMPATDIMVIGVYTTNSYRLTYLVDGEVYNSDIVECGTTVVLPQEPVKEGYTFSGWDAVPEVMPDHEVVIKGSFVPNKYLVTFKIDGVIISSESLEYGSSITVPNVPEREGYTFNGWGEVAETVPATDVTYEGSYTINSYLLTFVVDGEILQKESVLYGTVIVVPESPVKEGYTFSGWSEVSETMPASNVTVTGSFSINTYVVTFMVDGVVVSSKTLEYGAAITVPTMPEHEGYTFSGWNEVDATVPAGDVTYHATYTANTYNVYYFVGATLVHIAEVAYGETIPEYIYVPTAEGDVFMGWIGEAYDTMPAYDVTYTANIVNDIVYQMAENQRALVVFDLSGRKFEVKNIRELMKGVYIVNGCKIVVK